MRLIRIVRPVVAALGALLVLVVGSVWSASAARADAGEVIRSFDTVITVSPDARLHVRERIVYSFSGSDHHGIERFVPYVYSIVGDRAHERVTTISDITVTSPSGAPTNLKVAREDGYVGMRIGDPDRTVSGTQTYVIEYDVTGAMNTFDGADGGEPHEELYWNATGDR